MQDSNTRVAIANSRRRSSASQATMRGKKVGCRCVGQGAITAKQLQAGPCIGYMKFHSCSFPCMFAIHMSGNHFLAFPLDSQDHLLVSMGAVPVGRLSAHPLASVGRWRLH